MQRILFACVVLFAAALPCPAQGDKPKPNTLTPKEIADGWILLFDGETTFGWEADRTVDKIKPKAVAGELSIDAAQGAVRSTTRFADFDLEFDSRCEKGCFFGFSRTKDEARGGYVIDRSDWDRSSLRVKDGSLYDGGRIQALTGTNHIYFYQAEGGKLRVRNIKLHPLAMKPLFNGKDLTGWKEFPGKKSKFTVTDAGEINVKDGPGDLQTTGKFKDFILQLECKSNGKHLNSGIFFRCRDNEYQNGYEAQIRNEFTEKPTQKYQIEEYDPRTNKLIGKKEILSTAVDYGTGAIYRRVPARKEMAKDGEWFGMTIVAHGNHLATWVNGVQVVDWTDNRPKSDNARTGCKLDAGHISIQGHDPTTDLSFRNIRIAEFK